jgi:hypothetical protein
MYLIIDITFYRQFLRAIHRSVLTFYLGLNVGNIQQMNM